MVRSLQLVLGLGGSSKLIVTRAPLRVSLGGGGTDFPNYYNRHGGYILGFALDKYVYVVLHDTVDSKIRLKYSKTEVEEDVDQLENRVAAEALKSYGVTKGIELATFSDVPESSGLGGSSAFCVALVTALRHKLGESMDKYEIFQSAYNIERIRARQFGGLQDQMFAALGGAWRMILGEGEPQMEMVSLSELLPKLKLVYTNIQRTNMSIALQQAGDTEREDKVVLDSLDLTKELGLEMEKCIKEDRLDQVGKLFHTHWLNKKKRSNLISSPELETLYSKAMENGATGGKLLGLGGGGYLLFYVPDHLSGFDTVPLGIDWEGGKVLYSSKKVAL